MKIITVNIPDKHNEVLIKFVEWGLTPSKSECVRKMIDRSIPKLVQELRWVEEMIKRNNVGSLKKYMEKQGFRFITNTNHKEKYGEILKKKRPPLGNPYWEPFLNEDEQLCYKNKEDGVIRFPVNNGRLD